MRKLASIQIVDKISPIEGADKIEVAHIKGWQCVVQKGQFKPGDNALYIEIDSALPIEDERFSFLRERCSRKFLQGQEVIKEVLRIRTVKLRGIISQGLLMPLGEFPELQLSSKVEDDVTEILGIENYDEIEELYRKITGTSRLAGNAKGNFPSHLCPKTDEDRLQGLPEYFAEKIDEEYEVSEKADGSSMTVMFAPIARPESPVFVCSRNLELKDEGDNLYWATARKYNLIDNLKSYCEEHGSQLSLQMELVGPGVNGNKDRYTEHEIRLFRVFDITNQKWVASEGRLSLAQILGIPHVKIIRNHWKAFLELKTMEDFLSFVRGKTDRGFEREGLVFKANNGSHSFKVINNDYLLKQE